MASSFSNSLYQAYGLTLCSEFALPELPVAPDSNSPPDVFIELGTCLKTAPVDNLGRPEAGLGKSHAFETGKAMLFFSSVGRFTVTDGRHILVEPLEGLGPSSWRLPLLGSVLALLLEQRDFFVLHAGALDMGGFAAAFLGRKGQGKSTLNAALSVAGYPLLSDDVVALRWHDFSNLPLGNHQQNSNDDQTQPLVWPGFSQVKLRPDATRAVLKEEGNWPAVAPELVQSPFSKISFPAPLATRPLPLRHLFVLASLPDMESPLRNEAVGENVRLRRLAPQEAFFQLLPNTYGARFGESYLKDARKKTHFAACARLVRECQIWELARRRDLALLPSTLEAIAQTVGATPPELQRH